MFAKCSIVMLLVLLNVGYWVSHPNDSRTSKIETASYLDVDELRQLGAAGLTKALEIYDELRTSKDADSQSQLEALESKIDEIAAQRHAAQSRLYWFTDLEKAKLAASESGKPILSLRMLGKLTDEFSCANSRFFRTALYANKAISDQIRGNFVLHWQSVRPVPRVTIDLVMAENFIER